MKKIFSEKEVDLIVGNAVASNAFEGFITSEKEVEELKELVRGNISLKAYKETALEMCKAYGR